MYINIKTLEWPVSESEIKALYPNTSFPSDFVVPEPFEPIYGTAEPTYNTMMQGVRQITPTLSSDGKWIQTWQVYELTPEQISANEEQARNINKTSAEQLLKESDWSENPSVTDTSKPLHLVNAAAWDAYRDALRAIAVNPPVTVDVWPVKPEEVWSPVA